MPPERQVDQVVEGRKGRAADVLSRRLMDPMGVMGRARRPRIGVIR